MEVKHNCKYLFSHFNETVYISQYLYKSVTMNRTEAETLQLASTTSWKLYYARGQFNLSMEIQ